MLCKGLGTHLDAILLVDGLGGCMDREGMIGEDGSHCVGMFVVEI